MPGLALVDLEPVPEHYAGILRAVLPAGVSTAVTYLAVNATLGKGVVYCADSGFTGGTVVWIERQATRALLWQALNDPITTAQRNGFNARLSAWGLNTLPTGTLTLRQALAFARNQVGANAGLGDGE